METTMSRSNFSVNERGAWLDEASGITRDVVNGYRQQGMKVQHAFDAAATDLSTTPRRVRALYYLDGVWAVVRAERERLLARYLEHLDCRGAWHARQTAALRLRKQQLALDLNRGEECGLSVSGGGLPPSPLPTGAGRPR